MIHEVHNGDKSWNRPCIRLIPPKEKKNLTILSNVKHLYVWKRERKNSTCVRLIWAAKKSVATFFSCWSKAFWVIELKDRHKKALRLVCTFFSLLMVRLRRLIVWHHEKMLMHGKIFKSDLLKTSIAKLCDAFCLPWKFAHNIFFSTLTSFSVCRRSIFFSSYIYAQYLNTSPRMVFLQWNPHKKLHTKRKGMCNKKKVIQRTLGWFESRQNMRKILNCRANGAVYTFWNFKDFNTVWNICFAPWNRTR